jgi:hypothetical protein
MTTPRITLPSSPSSFWRKTKLLSSPTTLLPWFGNLWLRPISKNEIEAERTPVWYHRGRIAESVWHSDIKWLPEAFQNGGDGRTAVYMREGTTSRVMAADRAYGEFYNFYSVSLEYFGHTLVSPTLNYVNISPSNTNTFPRKTDSSYTGHLLLLNPILTSL